MYPIYSAWVLDATTLLPNAALKGQQVQVVTRNTTTPYPIFDAASDPIPSALVTVTQAASTPTVYIDTETPETVYLDWYDAGSGQRGPIWFEEVSRQSAGASATSSAASAASALASANAATATAEDIAAFQAWFELGQTTRNVVLDPRATDAANWSTVNVAATEAMVTGATDGPTLPDGTKVTTYARYTVTSNTGSVSSSFGYSMPNENVGLWPVGTACAAAIYIRSSVALPAVTPNLQQQAPATPWTETGINGSNTAIPANTWTRIGVGFTSTVEAGAFGARAFLQSSSSVLLVSGAVVEVTLALATPGSTVVPPHYDGSSPSTAYVGNRWTGTPNASVSEHIDMSRQVRSVNGMTGDVVIEGGGGSTWASLSGKPDTFPPSGHTHQRSEISDASVVGRTLMAAADGQAARTAIGAGTGNGTSSLALGTTGTTAAPGNHTHAQYIDSAQAATIADQRIAANGGTGGGGSILVWEYRSGAYPTLAATKPAGVVRVDAAGPVAPTSVPSWIGPATTQARLRYDYDPSLT